MTAVTAITAEDAPKGRWSALALLATATFLEMSPWFSASSVLAQLRVVWGLSSGAGAWLTITVQLGFVFGAVVSAAFNIADLVKPRRLMLIGGGAAAMFNLALLASRGITSALLLRFATGAALALVYPPSLKAMSTWFRRERGAALGVMVGGLTLGSALPHLINGLGGVHWIWVIVATSVLTLAGGLLAELGGHDGPYAFPGAVFNPRESLEMLADRGVRLVTLGYFGHMWELYAMWTWCAAFYADTLRTKGARDPLQEAAFAAFATIGIGAIGCWAGGGIADRWGRTRTAAASMATSGSCAILIGFVAIHSFALALAIGIVWGFSVVGDSAQFSTMMTEIADQRYVGTALTLLLAVGFTLTCATIWLVPIVREAHGWAWAFALLAPGPAMGVVAMLELLRSPESARIAGGLG
jgi:MFS family permease